MLPIRVRSIPALRAAVPLAVSGLLLFALPFALALTLPFGLPATLPRALPFGLPWGLPWGLSSALQLSAQSRPAPCADSVYRAFDFWVGDWEVRLADGSLAGHNTIRSMAGGCALAESWRGAGGSVGESLNYHDPGDGMWHQRWVDASGLVLRLDGGPTEDGGMRLEGRGGDTTRLHRITWTPLPDGRVRQHWQVTADGGVTWSELFEGFYARLPSPDDVEAAARCDTPEGNRFDAWPGEWRVESRLRDAGGTWHETEQVWRAESAMGGCGFLDWTTGDFGAGPMSGVGSRFYDPRTDRWTITWVSTQNPGRIGVWEGAFDEEDVGDFFAEAEGPDGTVRTRIRWWNLTESSADWSYSVMPPGADAWQTVWEMRLEKLGAG